MKIQWSFHENQWKEIKNQWACYKSQPGKPCIIGLEGQLGPHKPPSLTNEAPWLPEWATRPPKRRLKVWKMKAQACTTIKKMRSVSIVLSFVTIASAHTCAQKLKKNNSKNHFFQFMCTGVVEARFSIKTTWKWQCPCFSAQTVLLKPSPASEPTQKMHKETRLIETCSVRFPRSACNNCYRGIWNVARLEGERSEP